MEEEIKQWKELGITECVMDFSCGGDSMNETHFQFYNALGVIPSELGTGDLEHFFDSEVYNRVDFYVNSDGHYIGESGTVTITLNEDETDFNYVKEATSEYNETVVENTTIHLSDEESNFIREYVSNIFSEEGRNTTSFKKDFILTEKLQTLWSELESKIGEYAKDYRFDFDGEESEWYVWELNPEGEGINLDDNKLKVYITRTFYVYEDSE